MHSKIYLRKTGLSRLEYTNIDFFPHQVSTRMGNPWMSSMWSWCRMQLEAVLLGDTASATAAPGTLPCCMLPCLRTLRPDARAVWLEYPFLLSGLLCLGSSNLRFNHWESHHWFIGIIDKICMQFFFLFFCCSGSNRKLTLNFNYYHFFVVVVLPCWEDLPLYLRDVIFQLHLTSCKNVSSCTSYSEHVSGIVQTVLL